MLKSSGSHLQGANIITSTDEWSAINESQVLSVRNCTFPGSLLQSGGGAGGAGFWGLGKETYTLILFYSPFGHFHISIIHLVSSPRWYIRTCPGTAVIPRRNKKTKVVHFFWGGGGETNKVYYGRCANGEFPILFSMLKSEARLRLVDGLWSHCHGRLTLEPLREKLQWVQYRGHTVNSGDRSLARHQGPVA